MPLLFRQRYCREAGCRQRQHCRGRARVARHARALAAEVAAHMKAYYYGLPLNDRVGTRLGLGIGASYSHGIPIDEFRERDRRNTSRLLNYLSPTIDSAWAISSARARCAKPTSASACRIAREYSDRRSCSATSTADRTTTMATWNGGCDGPSAIRRPVAARVNVRYWECRSSSPGP